MKLHEAIAEFGLLNEPALLLNDGRILNYADMLRLEEADYINIFENGSSEIYDRNLIPDSVARLNILDYVKLARNVVLEDSRSIQRDLTLYDVVYAVVEDENGHLPLPTFFSENFEGIYNDFDAYARERFEELVLPEVPDYLHAYLDEEKWTDHLEWDFSVYDLPTGEVAIFHN